MKFVIFPEAGEMNDDDILLKKNIYHLKSHMSPEPSELLKVNIRPLSWHQFVKTESSVYVESKGSHQVCVIGVKIWAVLSEVQFH